MNTAEYSTRILEELGRSLGAVGPAADALADAVLGARRVYVAGAGRSGLMLRAFAMRLMHLGLTSYVVGESVTPAIGAGDLLLIGSGSGETESLCCMARRCRALGAQLAVVTANPQSAIAALGDGRRRARARQGRGGHRLHPADGLALRADASASARQHGAHAHGAHGPDRGTDVRPARQFRIDYLF